MDAKVTVTDPTNSFWKTMGIGALVLAVLIGFVFRKSFDPSQVVFSNDGPLGVVASQADNPMGAFSGLWQPLNWIGNQAPNALPTLTQALYFFTGPIGFSKFYAPFAVFVLGLGAVALFYRLGFSRFTCVLGGIATAFNTDYFSYASWGLGSLTLCIAFSFFALASLSAGKSWAWTMLGGLAVGMGIMEGFDSGAIMSLYIAAFVLFRAWVERSGDVKRGLIDGALRVAVVALFAAFMAAQALTTLIGTQITGITGTNQQDTAKEERWDFATQWSLPKIETLRVMIPGLYGYRMDTPDGGQYWGAVGQQPGWETHHQGIVRFSGAGFYVGILVLLFACYGLFESFRKDSVLTLKQRSFVKFWAVAALLSLLFSFGRFAPFYKIVYALPYFSTIRNPVKFMHPFSLSIIVMFGYGLHALLLQARMRAANPGLGPIRQVKHWWKSARNPERKWIWGCVTFTGLSLLAFMVFTSSAREITGYLQQVQIAPNEAAEILRFSSKEIGWFLVYWTAGLAVFVLFISGYFSSGRFRLGLGILAVLISADMVRANIPWVVHYDYKDKYASNPVIDFLQQEPYKHRVAMQIYPFSRQYIVSQPDQMNSIFSAVGNEWLQHHFQFYRIHALDIVQMPRMPELDTAFSAAFRPTDTNSYRLFGRLWQLTNTRYLLGEKVMLAFLNGAIDPVAKRFIIRTNFDIVPKTQNMEKVRIEDFTAQLNPNGRYSIFEFTGALPRAALFSNWEVNPDGPATLAKLTSPEFDPASLAIAASGIAPASPGTNSAGTVEITRYQPRHIELKAEVKTPSLLILFDRYDPQWSVRVDGKEESLVRADYIFRGVFLTPGTHEIQFTFRTPLRALYVSVAAIFFSLALCFYVGLRGD